MPSIDSIIKNEIKKALEAAQKDLTSKQEELTRAKAHVKSLKKSLICKHEWGDGMRGLQVNSDECTKCDWWHMY
jgi:hypothetical protein